LDSEGITSATGRLGGAKVRFVKRKFEEQHQKNLPFMKKIGLNRTADDKKAFLPLTMLDHIHIFLLPRSTQGLRDGRQIIICWQTDVFIKVEISCVRIA